MTEKITIHNGPNTVDMNAEELARLFAEPKQRWGNLEIAVLFRDQYASIHWSGFCEREPPPVGSGFLIRHRGESPLGSHETPESLEILDGGSEPFTATARHLLTAEEVGWLVWQLGRQARRPTHWPDGRPLVWSDVMVDDMPWRAVGAIDEPYFDGVIDRLIGCVNPQELDVADWPRPRGEPAWLGQLCVRLEDRALTDREAETLPRTAIWSVLRQLDDVTDAGWFGLIARHPMPWLRSLTLSLDDLEGLPAAVRSLPRLAELAMYGQCLVPAIEAPRLEDLFMECSTGECLTEFLRDSRLPALRLLALFGEALTEPIDFSPLRVGAIVHVELGPADALELLRNATSARILSLEPGPEHSAEGLVEVLAGRAGLDTWVSGLWCNAVAAHELARERGVRLRVG